MAAVFHCKRHPEGIIRTTAGLVHFSAGLAVVDDETLAEALRQVPEAMGVTEHGAPPAPVKPPAPPVPAPAVVQPAAPPAPAPVEPVKPQPAKPRPQQK